MSKMTVEEVTPIIAIRLYKGSKLLSSGCMIWQRAFKLVNDWRYPVIHVDGRQRYARAVAWIIKHGTLPPKGGVSPICGHVDCVAPSHQVSKFETYNPGDNFNVTSDRLLHR